MDELEILALDDDLVEELIDRGAEPEQIELLDMMAANGEDISELLNQMFNVQDDDDEDDYDDGPRISPRRGGVALGGKMMLLEPGFINDFISDSESIYNPDDEDEEEPFDEDDDGVMDEGHRGPYYDDYCPMPVYGCEMDDGIHVYL